MFSAPNRGFFDLVIASPEPGVDILPKERTWIHFGATPVNSAASGAGLAVVNYPLRDLPDAFSRSSLNLAESWLVSTMTPSFHGDAFLTLVTSAYACNPRAGLVPAAEAPRTAPTT